MTPIVFKSCHGSLLCNALSAKRHRCCLLYLQPQNVKDSAHEGHSALSAFYILSISQIGTFCRLSNRRGKRTLITQTSGHHGHRNAVAQGDLESRYLGFGNSKVLEVGGLNFFWQCQHFAIKQSNLHI